MIVTLKLFRHVNFLTSHRLFSRSYKSESSKPYYITTPIFYVNSSPHIGHLYTALLADAQARYQDLLEKHNGVILSTGTDEHGLKIQQAAEKAGIPPQNFCDHVSKSYTELFQEFGLLKDHNFVRTSSPEHKEAVVALWDTLKANGFIYKDIYEGWYSVQDETFLTSQQTVDKVNPKTGKAEKVSLESGHPVE